MPLLIGLLELFVLGLGSWTILLWLGLFLDLPVAAIVALFAVVFALAAGLRATLWSRSRHAMDSTERRFARRVLSLALAIGALATILCRPDWDDVGYLHQTLLDVSSGGGFTSRPFSMARAHRQPGVVVPGLAEIEAWEMLVAGLSSRLGLEVVGAYHNLFAAVAGFYWVIVYALLFRWFRVPPGRAPLAVALTVAFLLLDGNTHRSFGNMSLARIWQGKVVATAVLLPAIHWLALRLLARPQPYRAFLLGLAVASGLSMHRSMLFMLAVFFGGFTVACGIGWLGRRPRPPRRPAALAIVAGLGLALMLAGLWLAHRLNVPIEPPGENAWDITFTKVLGSRPALGRDLCLLLLGPALLASRRQGLHLWFLSAGVLALSFGPGLRDVWAQLLPTVCWRLYYALPLPLCVGLLVLVGPRDRRRPIELARRALGGLLAVGLAFYALERPTLSMRNSLTLKLPWEQRFPPAVRDLVESLGDSLDGHLVAAPSDVAVAISLNRPHFEGLVYRRRVPYWLVHAAESAVSTCTFVPRAPEAFDILLSRGLDTLVVERGCVEAERTQLEALFPGRELRALPESTRGFAVLRLAAAQRSISN